MSLTGRKGQGDDEFISSLDESLPTSLPGSLSPLKKALPPNRLSSDLQQRKLDGVALLVADPPQLDKTCPIHKIAVTFEPILIFQNSLGFRMS